MFERFSDRARRVLVLAEEESRLLNHDFIGTEHILLGLIREDKGLAATALGSLDIALENVRARVVEMVSPEAGPASTASPPFTPRSKRVLELSLREALQLGHDHIATEHLLLGLVREGAGVGAMVLESLGADLPGVRAAVLALIPGEIPDAPGSASADPGEGRSGGFAVRRGPRPDLVHPTAVLPGPATRLESDSLFFRVVGVLVFTEGLRVHWRISGIPGPITQLMAPTATVSPPAAEERSFPDISDDLGTRYLAVRVALAPQRPDAELAGATLFTPGVPAGAVRLWVDWLGQGIEVPILPEI